MNGAAENQQLGAFRLLRHIGSGGMGEVWLAHDTRLLRTVAVRILPPHIASNGEARARLIREAQIAAQLNHPSIATVFSIEQQNELLFLAMEFVDGKPLGAAIREGALSEYDIVRMARDIADALAEAHENGVVHRDIRPDTIMVTDRRVKILDFGIAKPEQVLAQRVDARTDVFSLGVVLYQALSGELPFAGDTLKPFKTLRPDLPNELGAVISRCLEKERDRRFATAHELAAALERVLPRLANHALPATPTVALNAIPIRESEPAPAPAPSAPPRILVVDDDPAIRRLFEALARRERIECDLAANGPEAIAAMKQWHYSLLFLDIMMPRIDGWGVLDFLRARSQGKLPMIFIVTAFLDQTLSAADSEIVTGIIYKPVDAEDIAALMREAARGGRTAETLRNTRHRFFAAAG